MRAEPRRAQLRYDVVRLKRAGRSNRAIAKALNINRRTVAKLLEEHQKRRAEGESALSRELPRATCPRGSQLDAYDGDIRAWLEEYESITAERCLEKLIEKGFTGKRTIVQDRLRAIRSETATAKLAAVMSHPPGQRGEFDWSTYTLGKKADVKAQVWCAQLSYSRRPVVRARTDQRQPTIFRCLRWTFEAWGGVPQQMWTDIMAGVVDRWECGQPIINARFIDFAAFYDFEIRSAPPASPTWKARTERRFWFVESNALNGRHFESVSALDQFLPTWVDTKVLTRRHPDRPATVGEVFAEEQPSLRPLPRHAYDTRDVTGCVLTTQGYVVFQTNQYPVRGAQPGEVVYVVADEAKVIVCNAQAQRLIEHERIPDGARIRLPPLAGMRRPRLDADQLMGQLAEWHDDATAFGRGIRERSRQAGSQLARLLMLQGQWKREDILAAMRRAMDYGAFEVAIVERVLQADYSPRTLPEAIAHRNVEHVRQLMKDHRVPARSTDSYPCLQHGDRPATSTAPIADDDAREPIGAETSDE